MWSVMVAQTLCELSSDVGGTRLFVYMKIMIDTFIMSNKNIGVLYEQFTGKSIHICRKKHRKF